MLFTGEKIGVGMGKTRKDAQQQAAENALHSLAGTVFIGSFFSLRFPSFKLASSFIFHLLLLLFLSFSYLTIVIKA